MAVIVGFDQFTKWWAINHGWVVVYNAGIAFGLGRGWWWGWLVVLLLGIVAGGLHGWGLRLVVAGGISNLIDRFLYGGVVDFMRVFEWFPLFNMADMAISVGVCLLLLVQLRHGRATDNS